MLKSELSRMEIGMPGQLRRLTYSGTTHTARDKRETWSSTDRGHETGTQQ